MPENKKNLIQIKRKYNADLAIVEGKINHNEFVIQHQVGDKNEWFEIDYVAAHPFFLHSLLLNLKVEDRIRAVLRLNGFSFRDVERVGRFGGSILFKFLNEEDRKLNESSARIALVLDMPIIFALRDEPTSNERKQYEYLEFQEYGSKISFDELKRTLIRPKTRGIFAYQVELGKDIYNANIIHKLFRFCRVDLQKTFFSVEFYFNSSLNIDVDLVKTIVEMFDSRIYRVILSTPVLRDTFKLSVIGTYIEEQHKDAEKFAKRLLEYYKGTQLFPYNFVFDIENVVPN